MSKVKTAATAAQVEAAATEAANDTNDDAVKERHDPTFINTDWGAVAVYGHEHVSKKELLILGRMLTMSVFDDIDHGVRSVVFRTDNRPHRNGAPMLATCDLDSGAININLMHTFSEAMEECIDCDRDGVMFSIRSLLHQSILESFLHEIHHIHLLSWDMSLRAKIDKDTKGKLLAQMEKDADEFARGELYTLAQNVDIEPGHVGESAFFASQVMEMLKDDKSDFGEAQRAMLENNVFFTKEKDDEQHGIAIHSFKEFMHRQSEDSLDDEKWLKPTVGVPLTGETILEQAIEVNPATEPVAEATVVGADHPAMGHPDGAQLATAADMPWHDDQLDTSFADYCEDEPVIADTVAAATFTPVQPAPVVATAPAPTAGPAVAPAPAVFTPVAPAPTVASAQPVPVAVAGPVAQVYPDTGLTGEQTKAIVFGVFNKVYEHFFTHCGRPQGFPDYDAHVDDGGVVPCNIHNVHTMGIPLTEAEKSVVVEMDCLDANGKWCPIMPTAGGMLQGFIAKTAGIPMYKLYVNMGGVRYVRLLMPQNPAKVGSRPAAAALGGTRIMYVMDGVDKVEGQKSNFLFKCIDGVWQEC